MYHRIDDQERNPENYVLKEMRPGETEHECFDFLSKPRQTQKTIGLYLKKIKGSEASPPPTEDPNEKCPEKKFSLQPGNRTLERNVKRNKGFWVGRPEVVAPITYKLREKYTVDIPRKTKRDQGVFFRPKFLELDYVIERAKAGLLYSDEESSESEEEPPKDELECPELKKPEFEICDPCKEKKREKEKALPKPPKDLIEELRRNGTKPPFKKIPSGCHCDFFGEHNRPPGTWDNPFRDRVDMLRQHEMDKVLRPFRQQLLIANYDRNPPVKFMAHVPGKKTFPAYQISNL